MKKNLSEIEKKILNIIKMRIQIENIEYSAEDLIKIVEIKLEKYNNLKGLNNISIKDINILLDEIINEKKKENNRTNKFVENIERNNLVLKDIKISKEKVKTATSVDKMFINSSRLFSNNKNLKRELKTMKFNKYEKIERESIKFYKEAKNNKFKSKKLIETEIINECDINKKTFDKSEMLRQILNFNKNFIYSIEK